MRYLNNYTVFGEVNKLDFSFNSINESEEKFDKWLDKTVDKVKSSIDKFDSDDKIYSYYKLLVSKISSLNRKSKVAIFSAMLPIFMFSLSSSKIYNEIPSDIKDEVKIEMSSSNINKEYKYEYVYKVKSGDILGDIAREYEVSIDDIKMNNLLKSDYIQVDQELNIKSDKEIDKVEEKSFDAFLKALAFRESTNRWKVVNDGGYMGLYQIGKTALRDISNRNQDSDLDDIDKKVTAESFRKDPSIFPIELQNKAIKQILKNNSHYLRKYKDYIGKTINGVKLTESAILAGSHLVGHRAVKKFIKSNGKTIEKDGNDVPITQYMKLFKDYKIEL